jgi:hypothetical protein
MCLTLQLNAGEELDPVILFKIIEVLHSAYKANRLHLSDHLGFLLTLISRFRIHPGKLILDVSSLLTIISSVLFKISMKGNEGITIPL